MYMVFKNEVYIIYSTYQLYAKPEINQMNFSIYKVCMNIINSCQMGQIMKVKV